MSVVSSEYIANPDATPHFGVVVFPGSNCEQDVVYALRYLGHRASYIWHQDTELTSYDAIVLPGGFSYGDYLRCGAIARFSPVMEAVIACANNGKPVIGICNGFQILTEAHLLPGALLQNRKLKFLCEPANLRVEQSVCKWLDPALAGEVVNIPINHNEGNYFCDRETLAELNANGQVVLRYCEPDGTRKQVSTDGSDACTGDSGGSGTKVDGSVDISTCGASSSIYSSANGSAANGALDDIAGICNRDGNVLGLMPHPERACDPVTGSIAGTIFFNFIANYALGVAR